MLEQAKLQRQGQVDPHLSQMRKSRPRERGALLKIELVSQVEPEIILRFHNSWWMKVFHTAQKLLMVFKLEIQQDTKHKNEHEGRHFLEAQDVPGMKWLPLLIPKLSTEHSGSQVCQVSGSCYSIHGCNKIMYNNFI